MKQALLVCLTVLVVSVGFHADTQAQGWEQGVTILAPQVEKYIRSGLHRLMDGGGPVAIFGGRWWYVRYQDGTVVKNEFRRGRTLNDILDHVKYGRGDCDWSDQYGRTICYSSPQHAINMARVHGPIVGIRN